MNLQQFVKPVAFAVSLAFSGLAAAQTYTTLTLPELNSNLTLWHDGGAYSGLFPSSQTFDGVPFQLQSDANGNNVFAGPASGPALSTTISVGVFGVSNVYTLMNTAWGALNQNVGSITFNGSLGNSYTVQLIEGGNVRDHYVNTFVNTLSDSYVKQVFGLPDSNYHTSHLDMQNFVLPSIFLTETLTDIVFSTWGGNPKGSPFLAGATVASSGAVAPAVPEPETYGMLMAGLGLIGVIARRRKQSA